jgi:response regulator RpfG family c-di-GMP phosphodiesterase
MGGTTEFSARSSGRSRRSRVLVVDDEPEVLVALEDVLSDDHEVLKASSPERALTVLEREHDVAVVMSDQRMPGMTGDELLTRLRESSDATRVMVTGYAELGAVIRAVNNGNIFAYVTKPWDSNELRMTARMRSGWPSQTALTRSESAFGISASTPSSRLISSAPSARSSRKVEP